MFLSHNSFVGSFELPLDDDQSQHMNQLYTLDISNNLIQGLLPTNIGFFFPFLHNLYVSSNMFGGPIPSSIGEMSTLTFLDLSNNSFSGNFPKHFFNGCISLQTIAMDNNKFTGTFPSFVGNLNLTRITASRNNFQGEIREEMCELNQLVSLLALDLSYNNFSGELPSCMNIPSAGLINLQGNCLTGTIPEALLNSSARMAIDMSNNKFVGTIPESVYRLQNLMFLLLGGNQLQGQIPDQICKLRYLKILDLSRNNFTGSVPSCFNSTAFAPGIHSRWFGFLFSPSLGFTIKVDRIPHQIGDLSGLHALNLSHNHLKGPIPTSFHNLQSIESVDLSNNSLSGEIPLQLEDLHYLEVFNVCYNNLSGKAPNQGQFGTFDESSYRGNPYLNWGDSNRGNATHLPPPSSLPSGGDNDNSAIDFTSFCWSFAATFVTVVLAFVTILWINPYWRRE
ncbi:hypothetical protein PIB30_066396 [Stylosanthes scabra]|uniref:Uncharacterized protein n=1 Tax=Stylosanthes scabra TaxID=79078 RepID=A0ABU6XKV2_9FABA|nr:hypothetical protein [Stylosanthes scabra]